MDRHSRRLDDEGRVDLTPMLDVVFIMLIFFIVTASFTKEYGLDLHAPGGNLKTATASKSILVNINETNQVWVAGHLTDGQRVRAHIEASLAEKPGAPVIIQSHPNASNGVFVTVLDQARLAGAKDVSVAGSTQIE